MALAPTAVCVLVVLVLLAVPVGTVGQQVSMGPGGRSTAQGSVLDLTAMTGLAAGAATSAPAAKSTPAPVTTLVAPDGLGAAQRTLVEAAFLTGEGLTPKSVVYVPGGYFFAQNMMYSHTITVFDRAFQRVATIADTVRLDRLGHPDRIGSFDGSPVEAAPTSDGRYVYVSNYEMYGTGFDNPGGDDCRPAGYDPSYLYRVDVATMTIDQAIQVGAVPKYVAVTPDDRQVFVANWCSFDLSVVDAATAAGSGTRAGGCLPEGHRHGCDVAASPTWR